MRTLEKTNLDGICGGVRSYCSTLAMITQHNDITGGAMTGAMSGFIAAGCGDQGYNYVLVGNSGDTYIIVYMTES